MTTQDRVPCPLMLDDRGICVSPIVHDGFLSGVILGPDRSATLHIDDERGLQHWSLTVPHVVELKAANFRERNIIFELGVLWKREVDEQLMATLMEPADRRYLDILRAKADVLAGKRTLLFLSASYGCELVILSDADPDAFLLERI